MMRFFENWFSVFFLFCIVFIPLNFDGFDFQLQVTRFLFQDAVRFFEHIFSIDAFHSIDFSSDTISLSILILLVVIIAFLVAIVITIFKLNLSKFSLISRTILVYYLAFVLLKYGFDKLFKAQFYLPEPNILNTDFGNLSRDILYWSTMGTSRFYCISLGIIEIVTAFLLLFRCTRILGLLVALVVFTNVVLVNFGFDISVKTFSLLLLLMCLFSFYPNFKSLYSFLILQKTTNLSQPKWYSETQNPKIYALKTVTIGIFLTVILFPYFEISNFNDDAFPRPFLHGSYLVIESNQPKNDQKIARFYIHRKNYFIFEFQNGTRKDYYCKIDSVSKTMQLTDYRDNKSKINFKYFKKDSLLQLRFNNLEITAKAEDWRKMKVLLNDFHFFVDDVK